MAIKKQLEEAGKKIKDSVYQQMVNRFITTGQYEGMSDEQRIHMMQNPETAKLYQQYGQRKARGGGVTAQEIQTLTSPSFYTPESYGEFDKGNVRQAIIDQTAFINMHRNEGVWDVETNDPSWWSDAYLSQMLGGLGERINASKLKDAENRAAWEQDGVQRNWLRSQYQQLMNGKDTADPIEQLQNWTYFDWLQGDRSSAYDYGSVMSGYNQMDDDAYYAEIDRIKNQFEGADWESLTTYEPSDYKSDTEYLTYLQELAQKEQANRQTAAEYQTKLNDPQYRNTMALATASGPVEVGGVTYADLEQWATNTGNTELLVEYEDRGYGFLTPEELVMYQRLYEINPGDAMGYLDSLSRNLNMRRKMFRDAEKSLKATDGFWNGAISWAEALGTPLENLLTGDILRQTYHAWKGDADPNAFYFDAQNDQAAIRGAQKNEITEKYGNTAGFFYDAFNSVADVGLTTGLDLALGGTGLVNAGLNATKAYSGGLQSNAARDIQGLWSVGQALGDAGIEALFEKLGFDGSTKSANKIWNFLRNAFGEGAEEVFTNMGTTAFDVVMSAAQGRDNTLVEMYKAYTLAGAENPGMQVALDKAAELGMDFIMGAIPGGTLGGVQSAADALSTRNLGKSIAPTVNEDALLEIARAMPVGSESRRLANKYFPQDLTGDVATEATTEREEPAGKTKKPGKLETPVELTGEAVPDAEPEKAESKAKKPGKIEKPVELTGEVAPEPETEEEKAKTKKPSLEGKEVALDGEAVPEKEPAAKKAEKPGMLEKPVELTGEAVPDAETAESTRTKEEKKAEKPAAPKKGKLSFYQLGRLTQALEVDLQEQHSRITNDVMDSAIANRLMELGDDAKTARANAPIIRKVYRGQEVALTERAGIAWNKNASQVARELASTLQEDAEAKAEQNAKGVVGDRATASDEARVGKSWQTAMGVVADKATAHVRDMKTQLREALTNKKSALNEAISTARSKATRVSRGSTNQTSKMVTISDGESGAESKGEFRRFKKHGGIMEMVVFTDGAEKTVSVEDMTEAEGSGMAEIIEYVADGGTHDMSETEANTLAQVYQSVGGDADSVIRSYEMVYLSGYTGMEMPTNVLPDAAAKAVYDSAKTEAAADERNRVDRAMSVRRTRNGMVTFLGKVTKDSEVRGAGSEEALSEAMEGMTESQQETVEVVRAFAQKFNINMVLFESDDAGVSTMQNGSYDPNTHTVYIDINSGANSTEDIKKAKKHGTLGYAMMRTLGHEVTHAIESTSAEGYAAYKAAVKEKLGKQWSSLVQEKLVNALDRGRKLTLQGAEAEVVADASEYMLQDTKFVDEIDKTVRGKVKAVIADFVQKVRSIFSTLTGGHRESASLRRMQGNVYHYLDNLQQLWDVAAEEMVGKSKETVFDETEHYDVPLTEETASEGKVLPELPETGKKYSYAGRGSENANRSLLHEAQEMEFDEVKPETIRQQTGWFRGMDGEWRYEIDDSQAEYKSVPVTQATKLKHIYSHPVLFEAYPELAETPVEVLQNLPGNANAGVQGGTIKLNANKFRDPSGRLVWSEKNKDTLLHEIQHLIQKEEGFASGSNVDYWADKLFPPHRNDRLIKRLNKQIDELYNTHTEEEWSLLMQHEDAELAWANLGMDADPAEEERLLRNLDRLTRELKEKAPGLLEAYRPLSTHLRAAIRANREMTAQELYQKTAGEIEARDTAERRGLTPEQRKATLPALDEDAVFADDVTRPVMFSERDGEGGHDEQNGYAAATEEDFHRNGRIYNYDFLVSQNPIEVVVIPSIRTLMKNGAFNRADIVQTGKDRIPVEADINDHKTVVNAYTNRKLKITNNSIRHGLNGDRNRLLANAQIGITIGEVVKNGIPINGLKTTDRNARQTYAMVTPCITEDGKNMMAVTHVDLQKNEVNSVTFSDIVHSANGRIYKKSEPVSNTIDVEGSSPDHPSRYTISIADLLQDVNMSFRSILSNDVLKQLGEERPEKGTYASRVMYSDRDLPSDALSIREYLGGLTPTSRMTDTERSLLGRYQAHLKTLGEKEAAIAEQEEIIRTAPLRNEDGTINEELQKAKNRIRLLREQAARESRALAAAETSTGFARLMATSRQMVDTYLLGASGSVADAADALDEEVATLTERLKGLAEDITRTAVGQRTAFARGLYDQKKLNAAAKSLKDAYGSRMSVQTIADRLALCFGELYEDGSAEGVKRFVENARELAVDILQGHKYRYKSDVLPLLREKLGTISLTEIDLMEIKNAGLTLTEYKRMLSPYVTVAAGGSDLSSAIDGTLSYGDGTLSYGDGTLAAILGEDVEGNLAMRLYEVISNEKAREAEIGTEGMTEGEMITAVMADIAGATLPVAEDSRTIDYLRKELQKHAGESVEAAQLVDEAIAGARKVTARAGRVWAETARNAQTAKAAAEYYRKLEEQRRVTELREQKQAITEQLRSEYAKKLKNTVEEKRAQWKEHQADLNEIRELGERNRKTEAHIIRTVKRLDKLMRQETDQKNVPEGFKPVVEAMMQLFINADGINVWGNIDSDDYSAMVAQKALAEASIAYTKMQAQDGNDLNQMSDFYDASMPEMIQELSKMLDDLSKETGLTGTEKLRTRGAVLEGIEEIVDNIWHTTQNIGEVQIGEKKAELAHVASAITKELDARGKGRELAGSLGERVKVLDNMLRFGNLTPAYFFRALGVGGLTELNEALWSAEDRYALAWKDAQEFIRDTQEKYNYWAWKDAPELEFVTQQGLTTGTEAKHRISLTKEEAMSLYAIWKREAQQDSLIQSFHLTKGGFAFAEGKRRKGLWQQRDTTAHKLSALDMKVIEEYLTAEQKAYADAIVEYMSTEMAAYGNEASMALFGIKKYKEKYYFPMQVQKGQLAQRSDAGGKNATDDSRLKHMSASHRRAYNASNPLTLGDFTTVATEHINQMLTYSNFVVPIEAMNRVLNVPFDDASGSRTTIRLEIERVFGKNAISYLERYIADMNGGVKSDKVESGWGRAMSLFKKGAVVASGSVALQQPMSVVRALNEVDFRYFVPFTGKANTAITKEWKQLTQYSGVAVLKEIGGFDMTSNRRMAEALAGNMEDTYGLYKKLRLAFLVGDAKGAERLQAAGRVWNDAFGFLASKADQIAWIYMWRAVKNEQAAAHKDMRTDSPEFLELCGKRFGEVMRLTQVYDSTLVRSQYMRSDTLYMKMLTAFGAEPTLTANMLYDAFTHKGGRKKAKAVALFLTSQVLTALAAGLIKAGRDDDENKTWLEKYLASAGSALGGWGGNLNPLALLPGVRDLMNLLDGYDIERSDMSIVSDLLTEGKKLFNGRYADNPWMGVENAGGVVANALGIPMKNIMRDMRSIYNTATGLLNPPRATNAMVLANDALNNFVPNPFGAGTSADAYYARLYKATVNGDTEDVEALTEYLGILGKDEDDINAGVRKVIKAEYQEQRITAEEAVKRLMQAGAYEKESDAYWEVDKWEYVQETGKGADTYRKYDDFAAAVRTGENLRQVIQTYLDNGVSKETLADQITTAFRKEYVDLYNAGKRSEASVLQSRILTAYVALGYDRNRKLKDVQKWLEDKD